jgi:hypothetical protein
LARISDIWTQGWAQNFPVMKQEYQLLRHLSI